MKSLGCHARHATLPHPKRLAAAEVIQEASSFLDGVDIGVEGTGTVLAIDRSWTYWGPANHRRRERTRSFPGGWPLRSGLTVMKS
jgi:hypothetical protein